MVPCAGDQAQERVHVGLCVGLKLPGVGPSCLFRVGALTMPPVTYLPIIYPFMTCPTLPR